MARKRSSKRAAPTPSKAGALLDRLSPGAPVLWAIAGILAAWACGYTVMRGSDLWWHLATGRWIVNHHAIPYHDPWSFTAHKVWVVDAWLTDTIYWLWSRAFGMASLAWWKWITMAATFLVLQRLLTRVTGDAAASWIATLFGMLVASPFLDIRPQLHSFLCYAILLALAIDREKPSWAIVPLMLIWANLHAGFTLGLVTLPVLLVPSLLDRATRKRSIGLGAASVAICLVNPNGIRAFAQPIIYALEENSPFHSIGEWLPPFRPGGIQSPLYGYAIAVFAISVLVVLSSKKRPIPWVAIALGALTLVMSLKSRRFIPVFAFTLPLVMAPTLSGLLAPLERRLPKIIAPIAAIIVGIAMLAPYPQRSYAFHYLTADYTFPVETMNFVETNDLRGKVFGYFNWGGYIHLRTNGGLKVFIDGRASALFTAKTYLDYVNVLGAHPGWQQIVDDSGAVFFLWPRTSVNLIRGLLETKRWRPLYADSVSVLLVRTDHLLPDLRPTPPSPYRTLTEGYFALSRGDLSAARSAFQETMRQIPWDAHACDDLIQADVMAGMIEEGRRQTERCQKIFPLDGRERLFEEAVRRYEASKNAAE